MEVPSTMRKIAVAWMTSALTLAGAWAGVGLTPVPVSDPDSSVPIVNDETRGGAQTAQAGSTAGGLRVGAAKVSLEPRPADYGAVWEKEDCDLNLDHASDTRSPFPTNPNCLYMWGVGPGVPIIDWDQEYGLWSRSVAIGDGTDTVVLTMLDGFSYFAYYNNFCDDCGALQLAEELGTELGFDPAGFFLASTHSHAAPDLIGSGGGVAQWYMDQVADSIRASVTAAVQGMRPAVIEAGETLARGYNQDRRDTYYSAEDAGLSWFRALDAATQEPIATVAAFAAHPVALGDNDGVAHADYPGAFVKGVEQRFGGLAFYFQTGLGNMSIRHNAPGPRFNMGARLAEVVPPVGEGTRITDADVRAAREVWDQPYTNIAISALGVTGVFDRAIGGPAVIQAGRSEQKPCIAAMPTSVRTTVNAARIGPLVITGAPGEVFSNLTNAIKERNPDGITLPLGQVNDGLGYIMQEFEADYVYGQRTLEYEETFGSACMGDVVLEKTLALMQQISS